MDRRNFLQSLVGGVAAAAAVRTWPFRVFSFPAPVYIRSIGVYYRISNGDRVDWGRKDLQFNVDGGDMGALALEQVRDELPAIVNGRPNAAWLKMEPGDRWHLRSGITRAMLRHIRQALGVVPEDPRLTWRRKLLGA